MERVFTNRAVGVRGGTTSVTVRLPDETVNFIDDHLSEDIANRSEFLQHWAQVGVRVSSDPELSEALDWALEPKQVTVDLADYGPVTITAQSLGVVTPGPLAEGEVMTVTYKPPTMDLEDTIDRVEVYEPPDELTALRESQLEALRNRVR